MSPETREAAIRHGIAAYPNEACGLVIIANGKEEYIACRNIALSKSEHFVLAPEDYADAEDRGTVTAIVHTHPDACAKASQADRVSCEAHGLPWHIFSIHKDLLNGGRIVCGEEYAFGPSGYVAPLLGREFNYGVLDCLSLIGDYYKQELNIDLHDDQVEHRDGWWNTGADLYVNGLIAHGFVPVYDTMQKGDIILMQIRGKKPNHAGVYIGNGLMLHHLYGRLSGTDVYGGYWKEVTRQVYRRKIA